MAAAGALLGASLSYALPAVPGWVAAAITGAIVGWIASDRR